MSKITVIFQADLMPNDGVEGQILVASWFHSLVNAVHEVEDPNEEGVILGEIVLGEEVKFLIEP